jgi:hypothetical protein
LTQSTAFAGKFFGACNDAKAALDKCFKAEKEVKRIQNLEKSREARKRYDAWKEACRKDKD